MTDLRETLSKLHTAVAEDLLAKINDKSATPAEINAAIKLLSNNHVELDKAEPGTTLHTLMQALPDFADEERPN